MEVCRGVPEGSILPLTGRVARRAPARRAGWGERGDVRHITPTPSPSPQGAGEQVRVRRTRRAFGRAIVAGMLALLAVLSPAVAVEPGEMLQEPALETRARALSQELRCVVCQNQSIDASNAPLAHDLRLLVRERLAAGDTDAQVLAFIVSRYGEFVLLRPRLKLQTLLLWLAPALLLSAAALALIRLRTRTPQAPAPRPLSADEQKRLDDLLAQDRDR